MLKCTSPSVGLHRHEGPSAALLTRLRRQCRRANPKSFLIITRSLEDVSLESDVAWSRQRRSQKMAVCCLRHSLSERYQRREGICLQTDCWSQHLSGRRELLHLCVGSFEAPHNWNTGETHTCSAEWRPSSRATVAASSESKKDVRRHFRRPPSLRTTGAFNTFMGSVYHIGILVGYIPFRGYSPHIPPSLPDGST